MPAMPLSAFSIGMMTDDVISSGAAPGSRSATVTVAGSAFGNRSTPRSRNEKMPSTTSDMTSIVAKTGRLTQSSDNIGQVPGSRVPGSRVFVRLSGGLRPCRVRTGNGEPGTGNLFGSLSCFHFRTVVEPLDVRRGDGGAGAD